MEYIPKLLSRLLNFKLLESTESVLRAGNKLMAAQHRVARPIPFIRWLKLLIFVFILNSALIGF